MVQRAVNGYEDKIYGLLARIMEDLEGFRKFVSIGPPVWKIILDLSFIPCSYLHRCSLWLIVPRHLTVSV